MLDKQGRLAISKEILLIKESILVNHRVALYFAYNPFRIVVKDAELHFQNEGEYFIGTVKMDEKTRICIPSSVREKYSNNAYLPTFDGKDICILII